MSRMYSQHKSARTPKTPARQQRTSVPGPSIPALAAGMARPSSSQKGRRIDLSDAIRAKMENAFGDLSDVSFYESSAVAEAGAEAMAMGSEIAFAPGMTDFSSWTGQERLGHELSHVALQRSGAVRGSGFLDTSALEARADREGAMAAAGESVYGGAETPFSDAAAAPMAGPMQAKKAKKEKLTKKQAEEKYGLKGPRKSDRVAAPAREVDTGGGDKWTDVDLVEQGQEEDLQRFHKARDFVLDDFYQDHPESGTNLKQKDPEQYRERKAHFDQFIRDAAKRGPGNQLGKNVNSFLSRNKARNEKLLEQTEQDHLPDRPQFENEADDTIRRAIRNVQEDDPYENRGEKREAIIKKHRESDILGEEDREIDQLEARKGVSDILKWHGVEADVGEDGRREIHSDSLQEELEEFDDQDNWIDHHIWSGFRKKDELEKKGQNWWKSEWTPEQWAKYEEEEKKKKQREREEREKNSPERMREEQERWQKEWKEKYRQLISQK